MNSIAIHHKGTPLDFDSLVTAERPGLVRYFHHALHDAGMAEDLTQETCLRAAHGWGAFRGECSPKTWLRRIATNLLRDHWRSRASTEAEIHQPWTQADDLRLADRQDSPALTLERRQVQTCLGDLFAQLPPGEREALILAVRDAMPPREIARTLRLAPEAARARLRRARRKLAAMVTDRCTLIPDETGALSCEARALPAASMIPSSDRISPV
jgi:RNA polymerase sigma-70 factor, ECF subfamily